VGAGPLAVEFMPEPADHAAVAALLRPGRSGLRVARLVFAVVFAILGATALWMTLSGSPDSGKAGRPGWWVLLAGLPAFLLLGWGLPWLLAQLDARLAFRLARRNGALVPQRVALTPSGLRVTSAHGETLTRWPAVRDVVRAPDHIVFLLASRTAFVAPRRAFADPAAFEAFHRRALEMHRGGT